ncbi:MAG: hypothetical protein IPG32_14310 [Saprospirales bacterium]|nr:hypothetical protein [Saprospirales bacterium]
MRHPRRTFVFFLRQSGRYRNDRYRRRLWREEVFIWIWDAAGNSVKVHTFLLVQDNLFECPGQGAACSPVVQAISGMTLAIPGTGTATVPARDFDRGTYLSNCSSGMDFTFLFGRSRRLSANLSPTMISETLLSRSGATTALGSRLT